MQSSPTGGRGTSQSVSDQLINQKLFSIPVSPDRQVKQSPSSAARQSSDPQDVALRWRTTSCITHISDDMHDSTHSG